MRPRDLAGVSVSLAMLAALTIAPALNAAPAALKVEDVFPASESFVPRGAYPALAGKVVGVLSRDVAGQLPEGQGKPQASTFAFSTAGSGYYLVYIPNSKSPSSLSMTVRTGPDGARTATYQNPGLASEPDLARWGIKDQVALVEVEVNDGQGAPPGDHFVATGMRQLDGTKQYPFKLSQVLPRQRRFFDYVRPPDAAAVDQAHAQGQKKADGERWVEQPGTPREETYITWKPATSTLSIRFHRITALWGQSSTAPPSLAADWGTTYELVPSGNVAQRLSLPLAVRLIAPPQ